MIASKNELFAVLRQYNPWWNGGSLADLPSWRRAAYGELEDWLKRPPAHRAVLLSGARQTGKTTLLLQAIEVLLGDGAPPESILYATFDHPLLKLIGLEGLIGLWQEFEPRKGPIEYLFLDEIQYTKDWQTWIKHQVDFAKHRRIAITGSAMPLRATEQESGVGRWHTIKLPTLSFFEYLQIKDITPPALPEVTSLARIFEWDENTFIKTAQAARPLVPHFYEYLLRGGFPQTAQVQSISAAQKLLREDIVDKVLKRDMTALFGVRRVLELEQTFLYLCMHDGGILDVPTLCKELGLKKPTVNNFLDLLETAHLIYRLKPYGYGKEILRARDKIYLADAAIAPSVLLMGKGLLENDTRMGAAVETAFFKHVYARYYAASVGFSYWRGRRDLEVDVIAEVSGRFIPFEIKHRATRTGAGDLLGIRQLCAEKKISRGYVITKDMEDFSILPLPEVPEGQLLKIPAPLACYWLSRSELLPP